MHFNLPCSLCLAPTLSFSSSLLSLRSHSIWTFEDAESSQRTQSAIDFHLKYRWLVCRVSAYNHDRVLIMIIMIAAVNKCLRLAVSASEPNIQTARLA